MSPAPDPLPVAQDLERGVPSRGPHHPSPGMRARSAEVEALHRRAVARPAGDGTGGEELVERHGAVEDVPSGEAEGPLQVERAQEVEADVARLEPRGVFLDEVKDPAGEGIAELAVVPAPAAREPV